MTGQQNIICKLHCRKIIGPVNAEALSGVFASQPLPSILGGNSGHTEANRFSYWAARPRETFIFGAGDHNPFGKLQRVLDKYKLKGGGDCELPAGVFRGGWIGYFGYELGRFIEKLPQTTIDDLAMPLIRLCFYDRFVCYDRVEQSCWLVALQIPGDTEQPGEKLAGLEDLLAKASKVNIPPAEPSDLERIDFSQIRCNMSKAYYLEAIARIKNYIYEGDVYQVNFSQRFDCDYSAAPIDLYHWQNCFNPSPFATYIDAGDFAIVSASPEMFITIDDGLVRTKPIKGTRPRIVPSTADQTEAELINAKNFADLLNSEKEKAELNMIIDLERNDVAKICEPGSRGVIVPRTIEAYPTVFHAVATVQGRLRSEISFCDVLKAVFPGGSITGAPKIRSMEVIDELEPSERAVYTGSMGFIGVDDNACLNIAIRTVIIQQGKAYVQTGGGIVADSDAEAEWDETITKARALLAGINAIQTASKTRVRDTRYRIRDTKYRPRRIYGKKSFSK